MIPADELPIPSPAWVRAWWLVR